PDPVTVSRSYAVPQAGGTDGVDNNATEDNLSPVPSTETTIHPATVGGLTSGFNFASLPAGVHTLTFSDADGFATPNALDVVVDGETAATADTAEYVADYVAWDVTIVDRAGDPVSGLTLTALSPVGGTITADEVGTSGVYHFTDVAPQIDDYELAFDSDYYQVVSAADLSVSVRPRSTTLTTTLEVKAVAIIDGDAHKLGSGGTTTALTETGAIALLSALGAVLQTTTADANGAYRFVVETGGTYGVRGTVTGYTVETVAVNGVTLGATSTAAALGVEQFATATITVAGTPDGTATVTATPSTGVTITEDSVLDGVFNVTGLDPGATYVFNATAASRIAGRAPASGTHDPDIGGSYSAPITLEERRTFTGSVANGVDGATVVLFKNAVQFATTTTAGGGNYTFSGLNYGSYTVSVSKGGVGAGSTAAAIVVQAGSSVAVTVPAITLVPRQVNITFTVTGNFGTPTPTLTLDGNTNIAGDVTFTASEDDPLAYSIDAPGYLRITGTLSVSPTAATPLTLTPSVTLTRNSLSGTVTGFTGNASVRLCSGTPAIACASPSRSISSVSSSASIGYTFNALAPGTYTVFAIKGAVTVSTTVVVNDDGTVESINPLDLTPPPVVVP
ncbi:MAG: carboxypeptidase-like regulatory domain-containing protein, partial [Vicinamibacterales bacterium]